MANAVLGLKQLESLKFEFGPRAAQQKLACLRDLKSAQFNSALQISRLHETLCFMRAWPDDNETLSSVDAMLAGFEHRRDLKRHAQELSNSGIVGTSMSFRFYATTAQWLADHWPDQVHIDWEDFDNAESFEPFLNLLATYSESPGLERIAMEPADWIDRLKSPHETDALFVIKRLAVLISNTFLHEYLCDKLDIPLILEPGPGVPSRTLARYDNSPIAYQTAPLVRTRPAAVEEVRRPLDPPLLVSPTQGVRLVDLARGAMVTRERDLDAFAYADANDVSLLDVDGEQYVLYGVVPERRFLLETLYGFLILKNGVPISYGAITCLFNSAEVAYTIFDTFRGGESAQLYARTLAVVHQVFGCNTFVIDPSQLGLENNDALKSGAWWFYQKLGYRPRNKKLLRLMEQELAAMRKRPRHRSSLAVLRQLASEQVYLSLDRHRDDVVGTLELANVGLKITDLLASRFGWDRERGVSTLSDEAADRLGVTDILEWSPGEQLAWRRWSPLIALLDNLEHWPDEDQEALVRLVRAKGGRQELEYLRCFDGLVRLRRAVAKLAEG